MVRGCCCAALLVGSQHCQPPLPSPHAHSHSGFHPSSVDLRRWKSFRKQTAFSCASEPLERAIKTSLNKAVASSRRGSDAPGAPKFSRIALQGHKRGCAVPQAGLGARGCSCHGVRGAAIRAGTAYASEKPRSRETETRQNPSADRITPAMHCKEVIKWDQLRNALSRDSERRCLTCALPPAPRGCDSAQGTALDFSDGTYQTVPALRGGSASCIRLSAGLSGGIFTKPSPSGYVMMTGVGLFGENQLQACMGIKWSKTEKHPQPLSLLRVRADAASYY